MVRAFAPKTDSYSTDKKFIGAYVEKDEASYLSLSALHKDTSISDIIRDLITDYVDNKNRENLLNDMEEKGHEDWKKWFLKNKNEPGWRGYDQIANRWTDYKVACALNLKKRKIYPEVIEKIINKMERLECSVNTGS